MDVRKTNYFGKNVEDLTITFIVDIVTWHNFLENLAKSIKAEHMNILLYM